VKKIVDMSEFFVDNFMVDAKSAGFQSLKMQKASHAVWKAF
jgi:hypothetical protein